MIKNISLIIIASTMSAWVSYHFTKEHYLSELLDTYNTMEENKELSNSELINTLLHLSTIASNKKHEEFNRISCIKIKNKIKYLGVNSFNKKPNSDIKNKIIKNTIIDANKYIQNNSDNCGYLQ